VSRQRGDLVDGQVPTDATLMVLDPDFFGEDAAGVALQFVVNGGRLVIGGPSPGRYLAALRDDPPTWERERSPSFAGVAAPFDELDEVTPHDANPDAGAFTEPGSSTPLVTADGNALLTSEAVGRGEVLFLADVSPLANSQLARADNAAFGLLLAGAAGRPVVFAEGVHGYGGESGLDAIPGRWQLALGGLALAALVLLWARGRRLGPPEAAERELPPARREYVDALAASLQRTGDRSAALAPVRDVVRAGIVARAGLPPDAPPAAVDHAAHGLGFAADERRAVVTGVRNDEDVMAIGRALARVERWDRGRTE
jgi:hypothetical protein